VNKAQAIYNFWASFGIPAYEENAVYSMDSTPAFPYITYELTTDSFQDDNGAPVTASLWYRSDSWEGASKKADEISSVIGMGGKIIHFDDGHIWIKRRSPFSQSMGDPLDVKIKRKVLSLTFEFFCEN
jgi:hypothetical protein